MRREDFINMMDGRIPAERAVIAELSGLTELFPWFQGAHLLLLKALRDSGDFRFETQLRNSALYISDREHLYYYLRDSGNETDLTGKPPGTENEPAVITGEAVPSAAVAEDFFDAEEGTEKEPAINLGPLEVEEEPELRGHPILIPGDSATEEVPGIMLITDEVTEALAGTGFMTILDSDPEFEEDTELLELIDEDGPGEASTAPPPEAVAKSRRDMQTDLIDRFIVANPRIEPNREQPGQPAEDLSQASGVERGTFVTETLAHIYIHQGYYSRAIDIYEKLSLKYPEKSSYFAAQIEKVKEYLKK